MGGVAVELIDAPEVMLRVSSNAPVDSNSTAAPVQAAIASIVTGFLNLSWWQMPLAVFGVILAISGPSMVIAALKLRSRNLGPILDASGWAVNTRLRVNIPFGTALTAVAQLPPGSLRSMSDPYAEKRRPWGLYLALVVLIALVVALWRYGYLARWLHL